MKEKVWQLLLMIYALVPSVIRNLLCRLYFSVAERKEAEDGLRELINMHDQLMQYIDRVAIRYDHGIHPKHRLTQYHKFFIDRIEPGERVVDVGCGIGIVAFLLVQAGADVTGIDVDETSIQRAKKRFRHDNLHFVSGDVTQALPDEHFDVVVMSNLLEHIKNRVTLIKTLQGKYSPRIFLIRVPMINTHWMVPLKGELGLPYFSDSTHFTEYTTESFISEIQEAGLQVHTLQVNWGEIWAEVHIGANSNSSHASL